MDIQDLYKEQIVEASLNTQFRGDLENPSHTCETSNPSCGDQISIQLVISKDGAHIEKALWQGHGCAVSTAATHMIVGEAQGAAISDVLSWDRKTVLSLLGLEEISPGREKCMMLGLSVLQDAIKSYKKE